MSQYTAVYISIAFVNISLIAGTLRYKYCRLIEGLAVGAAFGVLAIGIFL